MSHRIGRVITQSPPVVVGPGHGTEVSAGRWRVQFSPPPAATGTKFLMLHFTGITWGAGDQIEIPLGYDTEVRTSAEGPGFWSRPIQGNSVEIFYVDGGSGTGQASLTEYGRAEGLQLDGANASAGGNANGDLFMIDAVWVDPAYFNPLGVCPSGDDPSWENVAVLPPGTKRDTARSVGIIVDVSGSNLSTCSATLIGPDLILTAGHCADGAQSVESASFTLDFQTDAFGNRPSGYNPRFHKVKRLVKSGFEVPDVAPGTLTGSGLDYAVLQIETPPGGLGAPAVTMRPSLPAAGEELFVIHHPRGTVKKVSRQPVDPTCEVLGMPGSVLRYACDSDNGSSGSSVFDSMGRIVAVNDWAPGSCNNQGQAAAVILVDFSNPTPAFQDVDVVLVFDRSGSMSELGFEGDKTKIEEAREAAALFIDLLRTDRTHRAALVSFSTSPQIDEGLAHFDAGYKDTLIGPPPARNAGAIGGLTPGGMTTIGGGLQRGRTALLAPGSIGNLPAMLLLTDGLENTPPMIDEVEPTLGDTRLNIIGFGSEGAVDGPRLTTLARDHGGIYTRAGEGLQLKKFFVLAFGNIFETAVAMDPMLVMPAGAASVEPIPVRVCGEETLTVVAGWRRASERLQISLLTPAGGTITASTPGVSTSSGATWTYLRLPLPFSGEQDGTWQVQISRPRGGGEFPAPLEEERFFVTATVKGGPYLRPLGPQRYYTGDTLNPQVVLREPSGFRLEAEVTVEIELPQAGTGNILTGTGLGPGGEVDGDTIDPRTNTLKALEAAGGVLVPTGQQTFELFDDGELNGSGVLEPDGVYGHPLEGLTRFEGTYTFHARAAYGEDCTGTREAVWSTYVSVGIDPDNTQVETEPLGPLPDGRQRVRITFTPRDRYGNYLGPGRLDGFEVQPQPGSEPVGPVRDVGDGSYVQDVSWDPESPYPPQIGVVQPERPAVVVGPTDRRRYVYSVKFLCGRQEGACTACGPVRPGIYATEINIHNFHEREVPIVKQVVPLVLTGAVRGREPRTTGPAAKDQLLMPAHSATMDDCCRLHELLLGAPPTADLPLSVGFLEIASPVELEVTAVYTVSDLDGASTAIDVEHVEPRRAV